MFSAIIPLVEPIVAVQVDAAQLEGEQGAELLVRLEQFFMKPVALVAWDSASRFISCGMPCREDLLTNEDLQWRRFDLPPEPEIPF